MSSLSKRTAAFSVEAIREHVVSRLFDKAAQRLEEQLDATRKQFFSLNGTVMDERTVPDNTARLAAVDKVMSVAGAYMKDREPPRPDNRVAIEIDPVTGIHKIVIGGAPQALPPEREVLDVDTQTSDPGDSMNADGVSPSPPQLRLASLIEEARADDREEEMETIRIGPFVPDAIKKHMFRDE
jgi:hypothetical protein